MNIHRIRHQEDPYYHEFIQLYDASFPLHEKRTASHQKTALNAHYYHLHCFLEAGIFVGFICFWQFTNYIYIEHYAINPALRGQGYGSKILRALCDQTTVPLILEIDPVFDHVSRKRLKFYRQLGFVENECAHIHPPYQATFQPHELIVLSAPNRLTQDAYQQFTSDLANIVMRIDTK